MALKKELTRLQKRVMGIQHHLSICGPEHLPYHFESSYPVTPGHTTTPKEGTGDILHLETPVGTAGDQYRLLTVTVLTVYAPITDGVRQDVTRTYGRN